MRMTGYYLFHSFINQIRKLLKTWVLVFFLICGLIGGVIGFTAATLFDDSEESATEEIVEDAGSGEDDAAARGRISAALAAKGAGSIDAVEAAVKACQWVRDAKVYVNETDATDANGIPAHSLATVIYAGNGPAVAKAIFDTKAPGIGTYGNTHEDITDEGGHTQSIYFTRTATRRVFVYMVIRRLTGCDESAVTAAVTAAVNEYINNGLGVAESLIIPRLYAVAYNADPELAKTFAVADIYGNAQGESEYTRDEITCPWNGKVSILASGGLTITFRD